MPIVPTAIGTSFTAIASLTRTCATASEPTQPAARLVERRARRPRPGRTRRAGCFGDSELVGAHAELLEGAVGSEERRHRDDDGDRCGARWRRQVGDRQHDHHDDRQGDRPKICCRLWWAKFDTISWSLVSTAETSPGTTVEDSTDRQLVEVRRGCRCGRRRCVERRHPGEVVGGIGAEQLPDEAAAIARSVPRRRSSVPSAR